MAVFKFFNYSYRMCKDTQIHFLPDCSFKICEKPSKFSKSVRLVIDYANTVSTQLLTTQTPNFRKYQISFLFLFLLVFYLFQSKIISCVSRVIDYADTCFSRISSQKGKSSQNCFCLLFIWGWLNLLGKKMVKNLVTLFLYRKSVFS